LQLMEKERENRPTDAAWVGRMLQEIEEDAFTRKSAGLDAATARRVDRRSGEMVVDDEDREAARVLRGKKKKKKRTVEVPLLQQKWVKAAGLVAGLLGLVVVAWLAMRSPSPEKLYAGVQAVLDRKRDGDEVSAREKVEAAERFLKVHGEAGD